MGQVLRIPIKNQNKASNKSKKATPAKSSSNPKETVKPVRISGNPKYHTVMKGQTLYSISKIYNVKVTDLQKWNDLNDNNVKIGTQLIVHLPSKQDTALPVIRKEELVQKLNEDSNKIADTGVEEQDMEKPDILANDNVSQKELIKQYREKAARGTIRNEKGTGAPMSTTLGAMENAYFVMHKTLVIGTIIKIKNLVNSKVIYAKVIGKLPETDENKHVIVRYTAGVKKDLHLQNGKCYVQIEYPE